MAKGRRAWRASEEAAARLLEKLGYRIAAFHEPVVVDGVEVSEIDIVAEKDGVVYAVEVKAGSADVSAVRQAAVNAQLYGARPMIVARGADEKARAVASRLGVELLLLPDMLYAGFDELREAVAEAVYSALDEFLSILASCERVEPGDVSVLEAIAWSDTFPEAAERMNLSLGEAQRRIAELARRGILPRGPYSRLRLAARMLLACIYMGRSVPRP